MENNSDYVTIPLPERFNKNTMYGFFSQIIDDNGNPIHKKVMLDFKTLTKFIEPAGICVLLNATSWMQANGVDVLCDLPETGTCGSKTHPIRYLDDVNFFDIFLGEKLFQSPSTQRRVLPLTLLKFSDSFQFLDTILIPQVNSWLSMDIKNQFPEFEMCFGEIFNNIRDHSGVDTGCVFAQHYKDYFMLSVSDFGVGIPFNVRKVAPDTTDGEAITMALQEGFSTKSTPKNRGAGLDNIIANIAGPTGGSVTIHSLKGFVRCSATDAPVVRNQSAPYPGTMIDFVIKTDNIPLIVDAEEGFEW
ncbi:hypothetical protein [Solidesulfovibrio sp. C21]|uniref:hypothetical protein n=1 Tax=Solidesulfovibrio sp. C21 TaxID=3398613 RepID=UPI0039FC4AFD